MDWCNSYVSSYVADYIVLRVEVLLMYKLCYTVKEIRHMNIAWALVGVGTGMLIMAAVMLITL